MADQKYRKPNSHEMIEAYERIRIAALSIVDEMQVSAAGDECVYRGGMNAVDNFRDACADFDDLRIVGVPLPR